MDVLESTIVGSTGRIPYGGPVYEIEKILRKLENNDYLLQVVLAESNETVELKFSELQEKVSPIAQKH